MNFLDRLHAFTSLGNKVKQISSEEFHVLAKKARDENGWFSNESVSLALKGIDRMLDEQSLESWVLSYSPEPAAIKTIGVAMAGNIPLVGFHDFLTVLMSGHRLKYKPSSKDSVLLDFLQNKLIETEPRFSDRVSSSDRLNDVDAIITTGSDNTARYFEYYFRNIPHIIRKNRVSCAIILGDEPASEITLLGNDIFNYYGLGCRNVSTLFVPEKYDLVLFLDRLKSFESVLQNQKYANNYLYQKSLAMLDKISFLDNSFLLLKENKSLVSPIATLFYETYDTLDSLKNRIDLQKEKIQVIASSGGWFEESVPFGSTQLPRVNDFADRIDTMKFLMGLR